MELHTAFDPSFDGWTFNPPSALDPEFPPQHESLLEHGVAMHTLMAKPLIPDIKVEADEIGSKADLQRFFEGPKTCKCCTNWVVREPTAMPEEAKEKYNGVAIRLYSGKDHQQDTLGGLKVTVPQIIVIQSPVIRRHIQSILADAGMPGEGKEKITIYAPFKVLFFSYYTIRDMYESFATGTNEKIHFEILINVMDEIFCQHAPKIFDLQSKLLVNCVYIWTFFPKGMLVYNRINGADALYELVDMRLSTLRSPCWEFECRSIGFNGTAFGWETHVFKQPIFHGTRSITELIVYPFAFHAEYEALTERLYSRANSFIEY